MNAEVDSGRINQYIFRIDQINESPQPYILHFDCAVGDLRPWLWPIDNLGRRVTPEDLVSYRASGFRRPCCLCAVPGHDGISPGYTESAVVLDVGEHSGEYIITCAGRKCAYRVPIEQAYTSVGLQLKRYIRIQPGTSASQVRGRRRARVKEGGIVRGIRRSAPQAVDNLPAIKLMRLNSVIYPGLPEDEFKAFFTKCTKCGWIMTRRAFKYHDCPQAGPAPEVIDLTMDGDEEE